MCVKYILYAHSFGGNKIDRTQQKFYIISGLFIQNQIKLINKLLAQV